MKSRPHRAQGGPGWPGVKAGSEKRSLRHFFHGGGLTSSQSVTIEKVLGLDAGDRLARRGEPVTR